MYLTQGLHRAVQAHPTKLALCEAEATTGSMTGSMTGSKIGPMTRSVTGSASLTTGGLGNGIRVASAATPATCPETTIGTGPFDYATLVDAVGRHAAALRQHGIGPGDRVALLSANNARLVVQLLACWWLGAVACPLNTRWTIVESRRAVDDCRPRLLLVDPGLGVDDPVAIAGPVPVIDLAAFAVEASAMAAIGDSRAGGGDLAAILYTGGTTGRAKGVMLSHANFWAAAMARAAELPNDRDSVSLLVAPLFHVAGLARMIGQIISGASCVTLARFQPDAVLDAIERLGISDIIAVPTMLQALLDHPAFSSERSRSLRRIAFGAAPMPPDLLARALAAWPDALFFQAYGLTETAAAVCINLPLDHYVDGQPGPRSLAVGRAGLGAEIRVVDPAGRDVPPEVVGEVLLRGPMITRGYWEQPEATAEALRDDWLHTGDGGRLDPDGYLFIVDRIKDMIISGGENVYPGEVEAVLRRHPAVADAAVVGLPDPRWGERVHAVVVVDAGVPEADRALADELLRWCRGELAGYKCPRSLEYRASLPLSAAGKVLKNELREAGIGPHAPTDPTQAKS